MPTAPSGRVDFGKADFFVILGPHLEVSSFGPSRPVGPESIWCRSISG